jgi:hypothetical protein
VRWSEKTTEVGCPTASSEKLEAFDLEESIDARDMFFQLNGKRLSILQCLDFGSILAFSGNGRYVNDPTATAIPRNGPIPHGKYYIVDRESGGRHGAVVDAVSDQVNGTRKKDWFALYSTALPISDYLLIGGVRRGNFRIHPVGYWGVSEGCITLPNTQNFYSVRAWLKRQATSKVPGTDINYYGTVTVI